jgi:hypothetical protein
MTRLSDHEVASWRPRSLVSIRREGRGERNATARGDILSSRRGDAGCLRALREIYFSRSILGFTRTAVRLAGESRGGHPDDPSPREIFRRHRGFPCGARSCIFHSMAAKAKESARKVHHLRAKDLVLTKLDFERPVIYRGIVIEPTMAARKRSSVARAIRNDLRASRGRSG